jgi:ferric-dicitrate binding protein FerR (iron transport regulator)
MTRPATDTTVPGGPGAPEGLTRAELDAAQWLVRMSSGETGPVEQAQFMAWCGRSAQNREAFRAAYRLWRAAGPALRASRATPRRGWTALALAASLLLVPSLGYRMLGGTHQAAWVVDARGHAVLRLDASQGHCRLLLGAGEDSFDVTPIGTAGDSGETQVRADDAAFSLKPDADGVLVTVTYGRVKASDGGGMQLVAAGQQMRCAAASRVGHVSVRRELARLRPRYVAGALVTMLRAAVRDAWRAGGRSAPRAG